MARYTGSTWKKSRRLGVSLSASGKQLQKRPYAPRQHGPTQRKKMSEYGLQLQEKQKLRYMYGLNERQFSNIFKEANRMGGVTGENFMVLLESRLDNLVYRLGLARTRRAARQLVNHGHVTVNGKKVDIPSYRCQVGDVIGVREKSRNLDVLKDALEDRSHRPEYLSFDENKLEGTFTRLPERSELPAEIAEQLIVDDKEQIWVLSRSETDSLNWLIYSFDGVLLGRASHPGGVFSQIKNNKIYVTHDSGDEQPAFSVYRIAV
jgi:small subunit ribosomal protein S4